MSSHPSRRSVLSAITFVPLPWLVPRPSVAGRELLRAVGVSPVPPPRVVDPGVEISPPHWPEMLTGDGTAAKAPHVPVASQVGSGRLSTRPAAVTGSYLVYPFPLTVLPPSLYPYRCVVPTPLADTGTHDRYGVRMVLLGGRLYDHPVAQAQYGIQMLESYRKTSVMAYLDRAVLQAQRLVNRRIVSGGWWYPYPFPYRIHAAYDIYQPPWFSMMAQGQALTLFVRLFELTGVELWKTAADQTYATFLVPAVARKPWGVHVVNGLLWLDEYPNPVAVRGDCTYNGHIFAAFGLYDYWRITQDAVCKTLVQAAFTTARDGGMLVRSRGWRSHYCVTHGLDSGSYHSTHMGQNLNLHAITGDLVFARLADLFAADYPPLSSGSVHFEPGNYTGYRFNSAGTVLGSRPLGIAHTSSAPDSDRGKVMRNTGIWYQVSAGTLAGYKVREWPQHCYQVGRYSVLGYRIQRAGTVVANPGKVYQVSDTAGVTGSRPTGLTVGDPVSIQVRATVNGVEHFQLATGIDAGWYVGSATVRLS